MRFVDANVVFFVKDIRRFRAGASQLRPGLFLHYLMMYDPQASLPDSETLRMGLPFGSGELADAVAWKGARISD
jgi:hypothetical protein